MSTSNELNINKKLGNIFRYIVLVFAFTFFVKGERVEAAVDCPTSRAGDTKITWEDYSETRESITQYYKVQICKKMKQNQYWWQPISSTKFYYELTGDGHSSGASPTVKVSGSVTITFPRDSNSRVTIGDVTITSDIHGPSFATWANGHFPQGAFNVVIHLWGDEYDYKKTIDAEYFVKPTIVVDSQSSGWSTTHKDMRHISQ